MENENVKKSKRAYREKHASISITVTKEVKEMVDVAAAAAGKSKAQYIVDLILKDNQK
ncbi:MAG: hypothetical protein IJP18_04270 [Oscillospiraceae bacterium]|nr:hypothetical protein [Oscillospiraceae bacterium]